MGRGDSHVRGQSRSKDGAKRGEEGEKRPVLRELAEKVGGNVGRQSWSGGNPNKSGDTQEIPAWEGGEGPVSVPQELPEKPRHPLGQRSQVSLTLRDFTEDFLHLPHHHVLQKVVAIFFPHIHRHHLGLVEFDVLASARVWGRETKKKVGIWCAHGAGRDTTGETGCPTHSQKTQSRAEIGQTGYAGTASGPHPVSATGSGRISGRDGTASTQHWGQLDHVLTQPHYLPASSWGLI